MKIREALVVAAHPDDEILGCGATIARLKDSGCVINVILLGEGPTSRNTTTGAEILRTQAHSEASLAAASLGINELKFMELPDNRFDTVPLLEIVQGLENVAADMHPEVIFTHFQGDLNIDHLLTHRAVMTAFRPLPEAAHPAVLCFEVPSSTEYSLEDTIFKPDIFINCERFIESKIGALKKYQSEMRMWPHPRSIDYVRHLMKVRGAQCGCEAAEAFKLCRAIF